MKPITTLFAAALVFVGGVSQAADGTPVAAARPGIGISAAGTASLASSERARFEEAQQLYRIGRWSAAYGRFATLADRGNADAARMALQMLRHGPDLYGTDWSASASQVASWEAAIAASGPMKVVHLGE